MVSFLSFVTLALAGMAVASPLDLGEKRDLGDHVGPKVDCKDILQYAFVWDSYKEAKSFAKLATEYISSFGTTDQLFINYFGKTNSDVPLKIFKAVAADEDPSTTLTCSKQCLPGVTSFSTSKDVSYCPPFFNQLGPKNICSMKLIDPGTIRGGTTLAELTYTLFDMNNSGYWCSSARWMAANHPDVAVMNSGAYNCFAMEVYAATQC